MKKLVKVIVTLAMISGLVLGIFSFNGAKINAAETFTGTSTGAHGDIVVEVTVSDDHIIEAIEVVESEENEVLSEAAFEQVIKDVLATNTTEADTVTGATASSQGLIEAIRNAIEAAGITLAAVESQASQDEDQVTEYTYDIVVVGAGGAGYAAAIEAADAGKQVVLIEKLPVVGGNTLISGGEMNAPGNWVQENLKLEGDSVELYYEDTMKGGDNAGDPEMIQVLAENALPAAEWLKDFVGVEFYEDQLFQFGGHSVERALIPVGHTGQELIIKLDAKAKELGVEVLVNTPAISLIQNEEGRVVGLTADQDGTEVTFHANDAVILATGGFGANIEMRTEYNPDMDERYLSTVSEGSQGDGITMAVEIGAAVTNMDSIQTYPVSDPENGRLSLLADTRFNGAVLINQEGERFVEELERRDVISKAILDQTGGYAYQLWTDELDQITNSKELHVGEYESLLEREMIVVGDTLEEVAAHFDIPVEALLETAEKVNGYAETGEDKDFNHRSGVGSLKKGKYYLMKCKPSVHHTMGGLVINPQAQVLDEEGNPIEGLYAAGELTGVIHGKNRLGGNAIADIFVFGRIAGQEASK